MADSRSISPADMTDAEFLGEYIRFSKDGWNKGRELVLSRWKFAVWLRPFVVSHGGNRRSQDFKSNALDLKIPEYNSGHLRDDIDRMAEAGRCLRYKTAMAYLILANHSEAEVTQFTTVRAALAWAKDQRMTASERRTAQASRENKLSRLDSLEKKLQSIQTELESVRSELALERKARRAAEKRAEQLQLQLVGARSLNTGTDRNWR